MTSMGLVPLTQGKIMKKIFKQIRLKRTERILMREIINLSCGRIATYNKNLLLKEHLKELEELQNEPAKFVPHNLDNVRSMYDNTDDLKSPINRHDLKDFNKLIMQSDLSKHLATKNHYNQAAKTAMKNQPNPKFPHHPLERLDDPDDTPEAS